MCNLFCSRTGLKPIETIQIGDLVWSREEFGTKYGFKPVVATKVTPDQELFEVVVNNELGEKETFLTTAEHPFYVHEQGWLKASLLASGMRLLDNSGEATLSVISQTKLEDRDTVFNFEVKDFRTYHIGKLNVWVHNANCCKIGVNDLQVGSHKELRSQSKPYDGKQLDHVPSYGALKKALEEKYGRPLLFLMKYIKLEEHLEEKIQ